MLDIIIKFLKALNSETDPGQISFALTMGMIMGLTPLMSLHNLIVLFLVLVIRANVSSFLTSLTLFSGGAYLFDTAFIQLGEFLLAKPEMIELWTSLYSSDFWRLTHFNNTLTLGSLVVALLLAVPLYFASLFIIINYREHIMAWVKKTKIAEIVRASKIYKLFMSHDLRGIAS